MGRQDVASILHPGIDRLSIAEQVYGRLRTAITQGEIPQGARVVEAQIAKDLNISRAPVREAVNRLLQDGLLESRTHYGACVIRMSPAKIRFLYELRAAVESLAIREVVRRRAELDLGPLRGEIEEMRRLSAEKDLAGLVEAELRFHRAMWTMAENPYVLRVGAMIDAQLRMALMIDNAQYAELKDVAEEHEPIIAAIEHGDADAAASLVTTHILSSLRSLDDREEVTAEPVARPASRRARAKAA